MNHIIVTHNAKFHADDVFAVATLFLLLGEENCTVIRTRDPEIIKNGEYVVDVGGQYNSEKNRFDHHQQEGAGERSNGVPYASVGLVWKKYGPIVSGSLEASDCLDKTLIQTIDAGDNGKDICIPSIAEVMPYTIGNIVNLYRATWKEEGDWDSRFLESVQWAYTTLKRSIKITQDHIEAVTIIKSVYEETMDKRLIVFDQTHTFGREVVTSVLAEYPEPLYAVIYRSDVGDWQVIAIDKTRCTYVVRKPLPVEWRAKRDEELTLVTGVNDAVFCHRDLFMCIAHSKAGALKMAERALHS